MVLCCPSHYDIHTDLSHALGGHCVSTITAGWITASRTTTVSEKNSTATCRVTTVRAFFSLGETPRMTIQHSDSNLNTVCDGPATAARGILPFQIMWQSKDEDLRGGKQSTTSTMTSTAQGPIQTPEAHVEHGGAPAIHLSAGVVVAIAIGSALVGLLLLAVVVMICKLRKQKIRERKALNAAVNGVGTNEGMEVAEGHGDFAGQ
ncbi:hypothetical protein B0T16DRAFT_237022 [Cercophora newfieldiana]|uniref:Uncharacterized protein n=1 Tax=Cercophora newfieldiana TaxID=92897 RepID=A0AA39XRY0_9PEZI|nr:hypothetical protein B0T16DRAFT_237022 [Cercophora newfieldiana]